MYRFLAFSCFVAVAFGGCGKDGWKSLTTCLQPTINDMKTKMEQYKAKMVGYQPQMEECLKSASCVWSASTASQQPALNASLAISCFKKHFTIVEKIEACTQQTVTDFAMPDFDQLGADINSNSGFAQEAENMKSSFMEMMKDSKCNVTKLTQCYNSVSGGGMSGPQRDPMCGAVKTCLKSSFVDCDLNNTKNVLCACTTQILASPDAAELTNNAQAFLQCIDRWPKDEKAADGAVKAFRPTIEKKIREICNFNMDNMCGKPQIQASAATEPQIQTDARLQIQASAATNGEGGANVIGRWRTG